MNTVDRNAPLSPVSVGGSEWSFAKYQNHEDGPYPNNRANITSPQNSTGSPAMMSMNGFPNGPRSAGGPSPPPSVGRSSNGTNLYAKSDSGRTSSRPEADEAVLNEHYFALRAYLTARDPSIKQPPNKARDKLLRLSSTQFFELSTDVFDELIRRQSAARVPPNAPNAPSAYLLPEKAFHPKRNQARQRLSSLGPPRFRDLAADVFHELERRFPHFVAGEIPRVGSAMSNRGGPMSRTGTPVNGQMYPPRGQSRMRRPSEASSVRGGPSPGDGYGIPPSPSLPNGEFARPMPKQANQNNTIVPNKSTMLEEDDDGSEAFGLEGAANQRDSKRSQGSGISSEADKKMIEEYQLQVRELQGKLESMESTMKRREDEMNSALDSERSRADAASVEKQGWEDVRASLEVKLNEAQSLNSSLREELERVREDHELESSQLREQMSAGDVNEDLQRENEQLRDSLQQQKRVTDEVRSEAQEFLREMRVLSEQSGSTYEKQVTMEKTIEQLEHELHEWRNRYARTKTQLRNLKGSSMGLTMDDVAGTQQLKEKGFSDVGGLVKDVHVTKFQMAIDELLQKARNDSPENVIDAMKAVVVSVRRITRDLDESTPHGSDGAQQRSKLRGRVSATANSLITASKNFAASAGLTPVSLVDAAASHLTNAIIELLRAVKIRPTPAAELDLDEDEEEAVTPVESSGFFSPTASNGGANATQEVLPPPPPFQGLAGVRASTESSAYSPMSSPRGSVDPYTISTANGHNGMANGGYMTNGYGTQHHDNRLEDLKIYLDDQNALLVSDIQNLVNCVRSDAGIEQISAEIASINGIIDKIISESEASGQGGGLTARLHDSRDRLLEANRRGQAIQSAGVNPEDDDWRMWTQTLPPIVFEIARETKEIVQRVANLANSKDADDDFA